jgi:hypothetical protein
MLDIIKKMNGLSVKILLESIGLILIINFIFAMINYMIYLENNTHYMHIYESSKKLDFFEFIYYSFTTSFLLGCDIIPNSVTSKLLSITQLVVIFFLYGIIISTIIS